MKDMTIIANKKIVSKESGEVRLVVKIDEENRKIFSVPAAEPAAEPTIMAAATYDRRWTIYEEPAVPEADDLLGDNEAGKPAETGDAPEEKPEGEPADEPKPDKKAKKSAEADPADPMKMSETIAALEDIFDKLNAIYFEGKLPKPVITVQTTPKAYGHCSTKKIWKAGEAEGMYEINLGAEYINREKEQTCATLLHEMVHLYCNENEISETCQKGRDHNKTFKAECEARNLEVEYDRANGYSHTIATEAFKAKLTEAGVDLTVRFARIMPKAKAKAERAKAHAYVCPICGQAVRTTGDLSLICGVCEVPMSRAD